MTLLCASGLSWVDLRDLERFWGERVPELEAVLGAVAGVHGWDGVPVGFPVARVEVWSAVGGGAAGAYDPGSCLVKLSEDGETWASTLVHELGHHLTLAERGEGRSEFFEVLWGDPWLTSMWGAVRCCASWAVLEQQRVSGVGADYCSYLSDPREVFARCYTQWVAERSGSSVLREELEQMGPMYRWSTDEFAPIGAALDGYFATFTLKGERDAVH